MNTPDLPSDELFQLERRIAQRADELARRLGVNRGNALDHWRQAEREVWREIPVDDASFRYARSPHPR